MAADDQALYSEHPRDPFKLPFAPIPPPPSSGATCTLSAIRAGYMHRIPGYAFIHGQGHETLSNKPVLCFLIDKVDREGKMHRLVLDLGLRNSKDYLLQHSAEFSADWGFKVNHGGVPAILEAHGVPLTSIDTLLMGHTHLDHIGDVTPLPKTVEIVLGLDAAKDDTLVEHLQVTKENFQGRNVRYLPPIDQGWQSVGSFDGFDFFGDGSLWLLNTPGHQAGHYTVMARTEAVPRPVYHLLGGDTAHDIRLLPRGPDDSAHIANYPSSKDKSKMTTMHDDLKDAYESMARISRMDMEDNINVCLAHDETMDFCLPKGDFVPLDGTMGELLRFKERDRTKRLDLDAENVSE